MSTSKNILAKIYTPTEISHMNWMVANVFHDLKSLHSVSLKDVLQA